MMAGPCLDLKSPESRLIIYSVAGRCLAFRRLFFTTTQNTFNICPPLDSYNYFTIFTQQVLFYSVSCYYWKLNKVAMLMTDPTPTSFITLQGFFKGAPMTDGGFNQASTHVFEGKNISIAADLVTQLIYSGSKNNC